MGKTGEKVRFGIIGAGGIAREGHVPAIKKLAEAELVAVCRRNKEKANELAREWQAKEVYYDYRDLVKSKNIDAVIIATPNAYHRENTIAAAEEGKHILCEKPLSTNLEDGEEMIRVCKNNGVLLQVGFSERFWNQIEIAKFLIEQKVIGEVYGYKATWNEKWGLFPADSDYRYDINLSGGACIIDLAIHRIDLARYLVGEIERVCADIKHMAIPYKMDDNVWILCSFKNGGSGCISANRFSPGVSNPIELYGTEGMLFISLESFNPFHSVPLTVYTERDPSLLPEILNKYFYPNNYWEKFGKNWISIVPPRDNNYLKQLKAFCESVSESTTPKVTGEDGLKALEVVMAAYKSVNEKGWVHLPLKEKVVKIPEYK